MFINGSFYCFWISTGSVDRTVNGFKYLSKVKRKQQLRFGLKINRGTKQKRRKEAKCTFARNVCFKIEMMKNFCFQLTDVWNMYAEEFFFCVVWAKLVEFIGVTLNVGLWLYAICSTIHWRLYGSPNIFLPCISVHCLSKLLFIIDFLFKRRQLN